MDDAQGDGRHSLGSPEAVAARREVPRQARATGRADDLTLKHQDDSMPRIVGRDGFSPDLPAGLVPRARHRRLALGLRFLMYMFRGIRVGTLDVTLPSGERRQFVGAEPGPHGVLHIRDAALMR